MGKLARSRHKRTAIVGGGAAGLSLALMLDGFVTIYEKEYEVGGLCRSMTLADFTFDRFGPHILGGIPEAVDWIVESTGLEFVESATNNIGYSWGKWLKHPFENDALGQQYVRKMWKADPATFAKPAVNAQKGRKPGGVSTFRYPKEGGYQAIIQAWRHKLDKRPDVMILQGDIKYSELPSLQKSFDRIVWCAPVPGMKYNPLMTATHVLRGKAPPYTAIYLPDGTTPFHRLSFPGAFSPENVMDGHFLVQGEVSGITEVLYSDLAHICDELDLGTPMLKYPIICSTAYGYPIPDGSPLPELPNVHFHGRTGGHSYLNVDGVVKQSMELAAVLNG